MAGKQKLNYDAQKIGTSSDYRDFKIVRSWPFAVILIVAATYFASGLDQYLTFDHLRANYEYILHWSSENQIRAIVFFIIGYTVVVAFSIPGATLMTLLGGFLFGTVTGTIAVVIGGTLGAIVIFLIARYMFTDFFRSKVGTLGKRIETRFRGHSLSFLLFLRLIPVFPFWLVNIVPAFLGISLRVYVFGTALGIIPGSVVYCSVGNGLGIVFESGGEPDFNLIFRPDILASLIGLAILTLVPVVYRWINPPV